MLKQIIRFLKQNKMQSKRTRVMAQFETSLRSAHRGVRVQRLKMRLGNIEQIIDDL